MIYTLTLNPAIDLFIETDKMVKNRVNRTKEYDVQANGKGINVSFILKRLGIDNIATGIGAGFTLSYIEEELAKNKIGHFFVKTAGITRINVFTHVDSENSEYKLVNPGPEVNGTVQTEFLKYFERLEKDDIVSISGSFSQGIDPKILVKIAQTVQEKQAKLVVDTSYREVLDILPYHPLLLKPNQEEVKDWFGVKENLSMEETIHLAQRLVDDGAQNVLLSLGEDGAALLTSDHIYYGNAPHVDMLNSAGAGDSMLGTFIAGIVKELAPQINLQKSIAAGSDTARSTWITDFKRTAELEEQIQVREIK